MHGWSNDFWVLLESVPDALIIVDTDGRIVAANERAVRLFGYARADLVGAPLERLLPERLRAVHGAHTQSYFAAPRARPMGAPGMSLLGRREDGTEFPAEISLSPLAGEHALMAIAVIQDISERQRLEEERAILREEEAAVRASEDFVAIASHELRTPLTAIAMLVEWLRRQKDVPPRRAEKIEKIGRQVQRMTALAGSLLDLSRMRAGRIEVQPERVDLVALAKRVTEDLSEIAARGRSSVALHADGPVECVCDRRRTEQALVNLVSNALKFAPGTIDVDVFRDGERARIRVSDQGPGIAPEHLPKLFDRFERGGATAGRSGLGLGLYITRRVVDAQGGTIDVQSRLGEGTTFTVSLPLAS